MPREGLNGSVELLATAMRDVFSEGVERAVHPLEEKIETLLSELGGMEGRFNGELKALLSELGGMEGRFNEELNKNAQSTNENMQAQLANQEKRIAELIGPN